MRNMKLMSVRIDKWADEELERIAAKDRYRSKSDYIRQAVKLFLALTEKEKIDYLYRFSPDWGDVVESAEFKYRRDPDGRQKWLAIHPQD